MSPELIAIIIATTALGALILTTARLGQRIDRDVADLRERMSRFEGLFEGFPATSRPPPDPPMSLALDTA